MEQYYSKIDPTKLMHFVVRLEEITQERTNLVDDSNFIQCSSMKLPKGKTFRIHKHNENKRQFEKMIAQESWVVIKGKVECSFYDLDDSLLQKVILNRGDSSFTLYGGHTYLILEEDTIVYEYKTGPYVNQQFDKTFLTC